MRVLTLSRSKQERRVKARKIPKSCARSVAGPEMTEEKPCFARLFSFLRILGPQLDLTLLIGSNGPN
jgi:hypothetical protein